MSQLETLTEDAELLIEALDILDRFVSANESDFDIESFASEISEENPDIVGELTQLKTSEFGTGVGKAFENIFTFRSDENTEVMVKQNSDEGIIIFIKIVESDAEVRVTGGTKHTATVTKVLDSDDFEPLSVYGASKNDFEQGIRPDMNVLSQNDTPHSTRNIVNRFFGDRNVDK